MRFAGRTGFGRLILDLNPLGTKLQVDIRLMFAYTGKRL
jgi:hypothetical protein